MKKIFSLLAAVLFAGSMMAATETIFTYNGKGVTTAEEIVKAGGTLTVYGGNSNIVADQKQKGNMCIKINKGFSKSGVYYYMAITLDKPLQAGDKITTAAFRTGTQDCVYGMDFNVATDSASATDAVQVLFDNNLQVLSSDGIPADTTFEVPAAAAGAKFIRLYRKTGSTGLWIANFTITREGGDTPATAPAAAPAAPTYPANQVKAVYSATYNADCNFGEWGSGTAYTQETVGKKYVTTGLGYFGLEFAALNCAKMEALHIDAWIAADASIGIVPIHGGAEVRVTKNLVGGQWNAIDIPLADFTGVTDWSNVYQIKIDNAANLTFWLNNVYFYTTVAPAADTEAPTAVAASLVSASYFSAKISATATDNSDAVIFVVKDGENELATAPAVSGVAKEITVNGLLPNTAYNFSVIAKDEAGNAADPVAVVATTLAAPAPATAPTYAADKVLAIYADAYDNKLTEIQNWYAGPAISEGNLTATSKALCLEPNTTPSSCFGLAFAAVDASAYDALEMDVYATTEGSVLNTQAIGIGEAQTFNLVAGQWNHIVLNIKGNTKADLQQVGFYDCHNLTGVVFIQNVLFVDTDAPVVTGPTNCAEAAEAALSVANNNDLYNDGAVYSITGYVTSIQTAYNAQYNNVSFWMADAADGGNVIEAYRAVCASAEDAPIVGDKVTVTGSLTKYNTTPEFAAGCTYVIVEHATPAVPVNLGEKTIAEFIALANTVDTCVITGVVANIKKNSDGSYNKYGNFDLVDGESSVYVYGLLTADGVAQKFQEMGIDEGDTLTVKAVYSLYNNNVQAKNAVFVAVKKAAVVPPTGDTINVTINSNTTPGALVWTDAVASAGWWQIMGTTENYEFSLSNVSTTETAGVYTIDDLDPDYSYITVMTATDTTDVTFVDGSVTVAVANDGTVTIVGDLVGDDGNVYHFDLTYADPKAERVANVTISNGTLYDGYASAGLYAVYGTADDNTAYVQLAIWADTFSGDFTEEDLDFQYVGSGVQDADGSHSIFSAVINVLPGDAEGVYSITADLLCYNNTLYKVSMSIGKTEGFENVDAAVKAIKRLVNGNVVIEKAGKKYNVNGAEL